MNLIDPSKYYNRCPVRKAQGLKRAKAGNYHPTGIRAPHHVQREPGRVANAG